MKHVVLNEHKICPKCLKSHMGAMVGVLDFYVCTNCFYNGYQVEMEPLIIKMVREYFSPSLRS